MAKVIAIALLVANLTPLDLIGRVRIDFQILFTWCVLLTFAAFVTIKINLWVGLFFILSSLSAFMLLDDVDTQTAYFFVIGGVLWYVLCVYYLNEQIFYNVLRVICFVNVVFLVLQYFNVDMLHNPLKPDIAYRFDVATGMLGCHNEVSALLALCFPAFLRRYWAWGLIAVVLGLILAHTFGGPLAFVVALAFYLIIKFPESRYAIVTITLSAALALFLYSYFVDIPGMAGRLAAWRIGLLKLYPQYWILGFGLGVWKSVFAHKEIIADTFNMHCEQAHNEPIQMLLELGIGFAFVLVGYFTNIFRRFQMNALIPLIALVAIVVDSLVFFPFHIAPLSLIAIAWMALLERKLRYVNSEVYKERTSSDVGDILFCRRWH